MHEQAWTDHLGPGPSRRCRGAHKEMADLYKQVLAALIRALRKRNIPGLRDFRGDSNPVVSATISGAALATPSSLLRQLP